MDTALRLRSTRGATVKCDSLSAYPIGRRARHVDERQQRGEPLPARESIQTNMGVERGVQRPRTSTLQAAWSGGIHVSNCILSWHFLPLAD